MKQETIDRFMAEYKQLCEDYGITIEASYADDFYLWDTVNDKMIAEDINLETYEAKLYVKPAPIQGPKENKPPMNFASTMSMVHGSLSSPGPSFIDKMRETYQSESPIIKKLMKGK